MTQSLKTRFPSTHPFCVNLVLWEEKESLGDQTWIQIMHTKLRMTNKLRIFIKQDENVVTT